MTTTLDSAPEVTNVRYLASATLPSREDRDWVTSAELVAMSGISYRQCDYWCRTGLISPLEEATPGSGMLRRFHESEVERAALLFVLLEAGISLQTCREVIDSLLLAGTATLGRVTLTVRDEMGGGLVTTALTPGARIDLEVLSFPGRWSVWSQASDSPGAYFMVPADDEARALGVKYAVVRAVISQASVKPVLSLIRTDPPRADLVDADLKRRTRLKEQKR